MDISKSGYFKKWTFLDVVVVYISRSGTLLKLGFKYLVNVSRSGQFLFLGYTTETSNIYTPYVGSCTRDIIIIRVNKTKKYCFVFFT